MPAGRAEAEDVKFEAGTTMAKLNEAGKITVGTKFDQPLFGLKGLDGKPEGFDVEIAKIIAAELGIPADKIEWIETPSKVREEDIEQGKVDIVVATYTINDKRKERITFAGPTTRPARTSWSKADNSDDHRARVAARHADAKVCSVTGSTPVGEDQGVPRTRTSSCSFDVYSKCADALRTGQVDGGDHGQRDPARPRRTSARASSSSSASRSPRSRTASASRRATSSSASSSTRR